MPKSTWKTDIVEREIANLAAKIYERAMAGSIVDQLSSVNAAQIRKASWEAARAFYEEAEK